MSADLVYPHQVGRLSALGDRLSDVALEVLDAAGEDLSPAHGRLAATISAWNLARAEWEAQKGEADAHARHQRMAREAVEAMTRDEADDPHAVLGA